MGYPSKLAHPLANLVIRELLLDREVSLKIGVAVSEYWPKRDIFLPSLGYQVLIICTPASFRNLRNHLRKKGAQFMSCFVESLSGSEGCMMDAAGLWHQIGKLREGILAHVVISMMGRSKGETVSRHHLHAVINRKSTK